MTTVPLSTPIPITLGGGRGYPIHFAPLADVPTLLAAAGLQPRRCLVVTDENVAARHAAPLLDGLRTAGWTPLSIVLPAGEGTKSYAHLHRIYDVALEAGIDRKTPLLALGGGVVGDLAGFAAATLLRGLPLVQLPTSLIAQVDSALGGKTGINHAAGKNLIGAFHQPVFVCADRETLRTLPPREWTSGLAEVLKHALIADAAFFELLEDDWQGVLDGTSDHLGEIVYRAAGIKATVVSQDEREAGLRAILNFGHTFGHAIERAAGYGTFTHGEAVAHGMRAALHLSRHLHPHLPLERADRLVRTLCGPGRLANLDLGLLMESMLSDKKVEAGRLRFVLLRRLGEAYVTAEVPRAAVEAAWTFARET